MTTAILSAPNKQSRLFTYFLVIWVLVGLIQNYFSDVSGEEAYYWLFSQSLDWGYLDHPPMVAAFTFWGYELLPNGLGLRMGMLLCSVLTLIVVRKTLAVKDDKLYLWIVLGCLPVHVGAFLVKTDVPLLLFVATFYYFYKQYLIKDDLKTVLLLALSIALIMLSKHHGFLVVLFTVLSNIRLLTKKTFWLTVLFTVIFMLPHTYWQYANEFATIKFHLYNRIDMGFGWESLAYYVGIQPIVFGPLIGVMLFAACYKNKVKNDFNRALKFTIVGVLIFFLVSTLKVEFHKHWTSVLTIPLILLPHEFIHNKPKWRLWMKRLSVTTVVLVIIARTYLVYDFFPKSLTKDWDVLHNWDTWGTEVKELSGGLPIMFNNHYERASRYSYLTGDIVHCYNTFDYRETQHDLMTLEEDLQGKRVFQINRSRDTTRYADYYTQIGKGIHYRVIDNFRSFRKVKIEAETDDLKVASGEKVSLELTLTNGYDYAVDFQKLAGKKVSLNAHFLVGLTPVFIHEIEVLDASLAPEEMLKKMVEFQVPGEAGKYDLRFSIQVEGIEAPINSKKYSVIVE